MLDHTHSIAVINNDAADVIYGQSEFNNMFFSEFYPETMQLGTFETNEWGFINKLMSTDALANMNTERKENFYISLNPMFDHTSRRVKNVFNFQWCYADLDVFHGEAKAYQDMSPIDVYHVIRQYIADNELPKPTVITSTGRGYCLLWKLKSSWLEKAKSSEHRKAKKRWRRVNMQLSSCFEPFCPDEAVAGDAARLLRIPGSKNVVADANVNILYFNPDITYTLYELDNAINGKNPTDKQFDFIDSIQELLHDDTSIRSRIDARQFIKKKIRPYSHKKYGKASEKQLAYCRDLAEKLGIDVPKTCQWYYEANKFIKRCLKKLAVINANNPKVKQNKLSHKNGFILGDYTKLYERREEIIKHLAETCDCVGCREKMLFLARYYELCLTDSTEEALIFTRLVNNSFAHPLRESEVKSATRSAVKYYKTGRRLHLTTKTFCEWIGITVEYYNEYFDIRSKNLSEEEMLEKKAKMKEYQHAYYLKRLEKQGKKLRADRIRERQEQVKVLINRGCKVSEMMDELDAGEGTIRRDIKKIAEEWGVKTSYIFNIIKLNKLHAKMIHQMLKSARQEKYFYVPESAKKARATASNRKVLYVRSTYWRLRIEKLHTAETWSAGSSGRGNSEVFHQRT